MNAQSNTLQERIQSILSSPDYHPVRVSELVGILKVPPHERGKVRKVIDRLIQEGMIVRVRKDRLVLPRQADLVTGRISMNEKGFGFVIPQKETGAKPAKDIFIPPEDTGVAMHGDMVVVRLTHQNIRRDKRGEQRMESRPCGRIIRILTRANSTLTGVLKKGRHLHYVVPDDPRIGRDIYVDFRHSSLRPKTDDRVVVRLDEWTDPHTNPEGTVTEIIGPSDDPSLDIAVIIRKHNLRTEFSDEVLQEIKKIPSEVQPFEREGRMDLRNDIVVTIDPEDARDFDDALSIRSLSGGRWEVGVHIADVSHYVRPGSAIDEEAHQRGNSVYLPDRVIPMLPHELSSAICSLMEGVERLTQSVFFTLSAHADVEDYRFESCVIRSAARLTYGQVLPILEHPRKDPPSVRDPRVCDVLRKLWNVASRLRARRFKQGSLDMDFPELKVLCDEKGLARRLIKTENDISHQLVEEFMLLANETVAMAIQKESMPSLYRIHEDPEPEKLDEFREFVLINGYPMGNPNLRPELQKLLKRIVGKPEEYIVKLHLLKSMKRAQYSIHPLGHYGLSKEHYTHFTSPIRRYADLIIHRCLNRMLNRATRKKDFLPDAGHLQSIAEHCSITERVADEAEKEAVKMKLIEYFERQARDREGDSFDALVTDVRNFGIFVELPEFMLTGVVRVSTMDDDFYQFDPTRQQLVGRRTRKVINAGDRVRVAIARVDRLRKQVDFRLVEEKPV